MQVLFSCSVPQSFDFSQLGNCAELEAFSSSISNTIKFETEAPTAMMTSQPDSVLNQNEAASGFHDDDFLGDLGGLGSDFLEQFTDLSSYSNVSTTYLRKTTPCLYHFKLVPSMAGAFATEKLDLHFHCTRWYAALHFCCRTICKNKKEKSKSP